MYPGSVTLQVGGLGLGMSVRATNSCWGGDGDMGGYNWASSNAAAVSVTQQGIVFGNAVGTSFIAASADYDAPFAYCPPRTARPAGTVNVAQLVCTPATVTRGGSVTCSVSGGSASNWKFVAGNQTVTGPSSGSTWAGTMVKSGNVEVTITPSGGASITLQRTITVAARQDFVVPVAAATQRMASALPCGGPLPSPPYDGSRLGAFCLNQPYEFARAQIASGPNAGYWYALSATNRATFDWAMADDLASSMSAFAAAQCGDFDAETRPNGFISYSNLHQNTVSHESGPANGHYGYYTASQSSPNNNIGIAIESAVRLSGTAADFDAHVATLVEPREVTILNATQVEPCAGLVNRDSDALCRFEGRINYTPYQSCP
jgi:hypothetical protein